MHEAGMNAQHTLHTRRLQRGIASIMIAVLLIAGVLFILTQTLGIVGTRSLDNSQDLDSTAALSLAESGLQRSQAVIASAAQDAGMTDAACTGIGAGGPFALGRGTFSYGTSISDPPSCGSTTLCDSCTVAVTGKVGSAARTLNHTYVMGVSNGVAGRGQTVTMVLKNIHSVPATSVFNMAWKRQDPGGNADATYCANGATGCGLQWNLESSSGGNAIGGMGVTVDIAANTLSKVVVQNISQARDYVEVGGLFPSLSALAAPTVIGSYWEDKHVAHLTGVNAGSSGGVNSGVANAGGACNSSPTTYPTGGTGSFQADTCTNWCLAADTLVFGLSGRSASSSDQISPTVIFNTAGAAPQNISMTRIVHFPNLDGSTASASGKAFSEVWYAYNQDYMLAATGLGATSYPAQLSGTVGATVNASNIANGATSMTVTSFATADNKICIGDRLATSSGANKFENSPQTLVTTTPQNPTGTAGGLPCSNQTGVYGFSQPTTGSMTAPGVLATSNQLVVKQLMGAITLNLTLKKAGVNVFTPTTISAVDANVYGLSTTPGAQPLSLQIYTQGTSGTTILLPPTTSPPAVDTMIKVYSGTGQFPAQTKVVGTTSTSFTVSQAPATGAEISGAAICGGTCAFFDDPASATTITQFTVAKSAGTSQWAGGFVCLKGVDSTKIAPVLSTSLKATRWQEVVQ
jgi:hypothetical protein